MIINSCGNSCFKIQVGEATILIQPPKGSVPSRLKSDIFIRTNDDEKLNTESRHIINGPGEYEIKGVEIKSTIPYSYRIRGDGLALGYLSSVSDKSIEEVGDVDVLFITITGETAKIIRQHHPWVIIPIGGDPKILEKDLGLKAESLDKLTLKSKDLSVKSAQPRLVLLEK